MHPIPSALNARSARASFVPGVQMNVGATHFTVMLSQPHCRQMNRELHRLEWVFDEHGTCGTRVEEGPQ
jgi:hypothetical protein